MPKRTYAEIRTDLLLALSDGKPHSYAALERKVNTNWETVRNQIEDLVIFDAVSIKEDKISITEQGKKALKKMRR